MIRFPPFGYIVKYIAACLGILLLSYLVTGLITLQFNPLAWKAEWRYDAGVFVFVVFVLVGFTMFSNWKW